MIPLGIVAVAALVFAALLEEAAAWYLGRAIEAQRNEDEAATLIAARAARQTRLLARGLVAVAAGVLAVGAARSTEAWHLSLLALGALLWAIVSAASVGVRWHSPWSLAGRLLFRPLRGVGELLRGILLAGGRLVGTGVPASSLERVGELDRELLWLRGRTARSEADSMVMTLHQFGEALVEDVMVPREAIVAVPAAASVPEIVSLVQTQGYSRYPVFGESLDTMVGVLHVLDLLGVDPARTAQDLARPALLTLSTKPVGVLLRELQSTYNQMAVVVDEYGGTAGLVTVEDLIEELVGEIEDELDDAPARIRRLSPGVFWVDAAVGVDEVNEALDLEIEEGEYDTLAGLILERLEHIPRPGEGIRVDGVWIEVLAAEPHRIQSLRVVFAQAPDGPEATR